MPRYCSTATAHVFAGLSVIALGLAVPGVSAQEPTAAIAPDAPDSPPAHISHVEGSATLERDGRPDSSPVSMPLLAGDRLRTSDGRVEVLFADGSTLHLDRDTLVDFQSDEVVRLLQGRLRLSIAGRERDVAYRIDAPAAWVQISEPGEYRVAILPDAQTELAVLRGAAELINEEGRSFVRAGERAFAAAGARPSAPYVFNSAAWDAFDQWSESRRDERLGASAQYLPPDVQPYAARLDTHGVWRHEPVHGYVWYPRVRPDWRPYYHGRWVSLRPYGWTWIAADPWGWPTHHYGRWGFSSGAWFWIPGRRWGAAWVSWAHASDYVSWCPLGWNDRPVFSFININVHRGRRYDPWYAWTVVPRRHFSGGFVNVHVVSRARLDDRFRRSFVPREHGPDWRYAVPRASAPIRAAGTRTGYAVPRGSTSAAAPSYSDPRGSSTYRSFPAPSRAGSDRGQTRVRPGSDEGQTRVRPGSDRGQTGVRRGSDRGQAPEAQSPVGPERTAQAPVTVAPSRAVPRDAGRAPSSTSPSGDGWRRYDRRPQGPAAASPQEYRREPGGVSPDGSRTPDRRPDYGTGRAVPRPEAPGSSEAPRRHEAPDMYRAPARAPEGGRQPETPRPAPSYDAPRPERAPGRYRSEPSPTPRAEPQAPAYRAPERRAPSQPAQPSGDRPSTAPSGDRPAAPSSGARPRGGAPAEGQAVPRRPRG